MPIPYPDWLPLAQKSKTPKPVRDDDLSLHDVAPVSFIRSRRASEILAVTRMRISQPA